MKRIVLTILMAAAPAGLTAQAGQANVRVRVQHEAQPVAAAAVAFNERKLQTDSSGLAALQLPPGAYTLSVSRFGYQPFTAPVQLRADTTIVVELEAAAHELEEIIVVSTRTGKRIEDQPIRVEVLAAEEIEEKTMMTPGDIAMLLNETSGLRVQITSPSLAAANVRVQGLHGRYTQLLSDGLPLTGGQSMQIPPLDLGQVEVIKGAASALYGGAALGGVINLISRRPDGERELLLNQTTLGGTDAVAWLAGRQYTLIAGAHRQSRSDVDDDGWADLPSYERLVVRPRLFWSRESGSSLFLTAGLTAEERAGGGAQFREALTTTRSDVGLIGTLVRRSGTIVSARASAMSQSHNHRFGNVVEEDRHQTSFAEATVRGARGAHTWLLGAALQVDAYRAFHVPGFDYTYTVPGLFAQDEFTVGGRSTVSVSARTDWHSEYGTFLTPRLSALHRPAEGWSLRGSVGTGYFAPTPLIEETEAIGLSRVSRPRALEAERALSASLDLNRTRGPVELNATLFAARVSHAVELQGSELVNRADRLNTRGTELLLRYRAEGYHFTATHTWIDAPKIELTPKHAIGMVGMREWDGRARVAFELYYTGEQWLGDNPYRDTSKPYVVFGLLGERRFGRARVFLNLENLLDARQTRHDPLVRPRPTPEGRWTVDAWAPLEGRVFNAGVRLDW